MYFIGSHFEILNFLLILFIKEKISLSYPVIFISSTYMPIIAIKIPFSSFMKIHFTELSWVNPLLMRKLVIFIFH